MTRQEWLTVGLIIGVTGALSSWAVLDARARARDITRLAHVRELQLGLEYFYADQAKYPGAEEEIALGQAGTACLSADGFTGPCQSGGGRPFLTYVPAPPSAGLKGRVACGGINRAYCYGSDGVTYHIRFELEGNNRPLGLTKGVNCATERGVMPGECQAQ